jgi:superfamily II helicase
LSPHTLIPPVAVTDRIHIRNHRQVASQLDRSIPRGAFSGATLDILFTGEGMAKLDDATRDRVEDFAADFLDCDCEANPHCEHPEEKFVAYLLELRMEGHNPEDIVDIMGDEYHLTAYPGDIRSFLEQAIRTLEAAESLADVDGREEISEDVAEYRDALL